MSNERINPYYNSEKLGWSRIEFDQPDMSYEYNTICFWRTKDGLIFTAEDSGCSCPTPFEKYEGVDEKEIIQKLERVGSYEQAIQTIDAWNVGFDKKPYGAFLDEKRQLKAWFKEPR